ncbi:hypothetical protein [Leifsonia sp. NPDC080035]|uniref:Cardiolipin synthase N-terminal domain-containing protein n=1 Tax=Leifsonia sp. NPDC080035 TaxID=3143936 RepID=A0AAU7G9E7_9MICO
MQIDASITPAISALWLTVAILAGGYARTRNRSAWWWFLLTLFLGPIAAFLLVTWPPREPAMTRPGAGSTADAD